MSHRRLALALGLVVASAYVGAVAWSNAGGWPARVLFDGVSGPSAYRYVSPPLNAPSSQKPQTGLGTVRLTTTGSDSVSVFTPDGQASIVAPKNAFAPSPGQSSVLVRITPSDPGPLGAPPSGLVYQGNAYTFTATYQPGGQPARLEVAASILLQYPVHATVLLHRSGSQWQQLRSTAVQASLQIFADSRELGVFAAAGPNPSPSRNYLPYISAGIILLAAVLGLVARLRQNRRRKEAERLAAERAAERARRRAAGPKSSGKRRRRR